MCHPAYRPYLTPNNFPLFRHIKNKLRDQHFLTSEEAVDAFKLPIIYNRSEKKYFKILQTHAEVY